MLFPKYCVLYTPAHFILLLDYRCDLIADQGVASSIRARSHTFMEIDHEIISTVLLLPSADSFKKSCQSQAKGCLKANSSLPLKKVWLGELTVPTSVTIAVAWEVKQQTKPKPNHFVTSTNLMVKLFMF